MTASRALNQPYNPDRFRGLMVGTAVGDRFGQPAKCLGHVPSPCIELTGRESRLLDSDDTIAAMAGVLGAAGWGLRGMPRRWCRVEGYDRLINLTDATWERIGARPAP